jgi:hypothetical protein
MVEKNETHFIVGTVNQRSGSCILFYPPRPGTAYMFD